MTLFDSIIFDMDGTLWDATDSYARVWNTTLVQMGYPDVRIDAEQVASCMGMTLDKILDTLISLPLDRGAFLKALEENERKMMPHLGGQLFDGVAYGVSWLSSRYKLFMVSNCGPDGLRNFLRFTGLTDFFTDTLSHGENGKSKAQNIREIVEKHNLKAPAYVGDTQGDADSAREAGVAMVAARYGFGKVKGADMAVDSFDDLTRLFMLQLPIIGNFSGDEIAMVGRVADSLGLDCYAVGGYVRDTFLNRDSKDVDFVAVGSGIALAEAVKAEMGKKARLSVFKNFGTAHITCGDVELEFVGARKESYRRESRKPIVEDGTLDDDLSRRDFTINAMAVAVNAPKFGSLIDPFNGVADLRKHIIRTPLDPDITYSDDPLRMLRAIRFATQLGFTIHPDSFDAIGRNVERIKIISEERIVDELMKIMASPKPSVGWMLLESSGLLALVCPELQALKGVDTVNGRGHKDNFLHTLQVLDNVAAKSDNVWLRWAALFHDIAKPVTKRWDEKAGWTFHNHNFVGAKMIPGIFRRMKMPMNEHLKYVQKLVELHMRPIALVEDVVTDSAVRRMLFEAADDIDDLMILCEADITSKNVDKVQRFLDNYQVVRRKLVEIEEKDRVRNFQPPISGEDVMRIFDIPQSREVGLIKDAIKDAILDGVIPNERDAAYDYMLSHAKENLGLSPKNAD